MADDRGQRVDREVGAPEPVAVRRPPIAVALEDSGREKQAPRVVASGRGAVAEQILALAFANGVKVREDADLAEILSLVDVESEVPVEALAAVAEILAYVYRANGGGASWDAPWNEAAPTEAPGSRPR